MKARRANRFAGILCAGAGVVALTAADAAGPSAASGAAPATASSPAARAKTPAGGEQGPAWATLKPAQQNALKPLERDWASIDALRKRKWLEIAERYPSMSRDDQVKLQTRMAEWARLTPLERGQVRLNYQEAKQVPPQSRQASWEAYQALPPEQRRELAHRAAPTASTSRASPAALNTATAQAKSNTVPNPSLATPPKPVAPTVVQVQPGATTTLISKKPTPPVHQPTGMPKIAATPEFVDEKTLLPQAGAQSTATPRGAAAAASTSSSARP